MYIYDISIRRDVFYFSYLLIYDKLYQVNQNIWFGQKILI